MADKILKSLNTDLTFEYVGFSSNGSELTCSYRLGSYEFAERIVIEGDWSSERATEAARLIFLLAGISYYKAKAPQIIDLGDTPIRQGEIDFLMSYYKGGLGEYAYKNQLSLSTLQIVGGQDAARFAPIEVPTTQAPLIPFGGGIDSIVTVELARKAHRNPKLFVMSPGETLFAPLEAAAEVAGLPVVRAQRWLDPQILNSAELGFLNGHVPVTAIVSATAVAAAVMNDRTAVLMSNEASATEGNLEHDGVMINHQFSKSIAYENAFRSVLQNALGASPDWFSYLRHRNELWIANQFAQFTQYHPVFRSCNRAFHIDQSQRATNWCGECDKCAFIDLILAPFLPQAQLSEMFAGNEPLDNEKMQPVFDSLVVNSSGFAKPFECVGDYSECRQAVALTTERDDRSGNEILAHLQKLISETELTQVDSETVHNISEPYATSDIVG